MTFKAPDKWQEQAKEAARPQTEWTFTCGVCGFSMTVKNPPHMYGCPECGKSKTPSPQIMKRVYDDDVNETGNRRQSAFIQTPEVQAKLKSGEYEIRKDSKR